MISISMELELERAREEYESGMALGVVASYHPLIPLKAIRQHLVTKGVLRPKYQPPEDPSESEIERQMEEFKASWSDQEATRRWVGRRSSQAEERGYYLSKVLRD